MVRPRAREAQQPMSRDMVSRESATGPVGLRRRFAALFGAGALLVAGCATAGGAGGGGSAPDDQAVSALAESANLDQCANGAIGDPPATCTGSQWQNGNLNPNNSQYFEKSSVPFRLRFGGLTPATSHTVVIDWDTTHSADDHTYDYLTTYDTTEAGADPCSGVVGCDPGVFTTFPVPADPNIPADPNWSGTVIPGNLTMFGGTITGVSSYTLNGSYTSGSASDTEVTVMFTTDVAAPVLAWAGHVASQDDWGSGHAAADISGSPYHMRVLALDGSGGNQDRALSVSPPLSAVRVYLDAVPDGAQDFDFTLTGPDPQSFVLDDDTDPTRSNTRTMTSLTAGTYTLTQAQL